MAILGLAIALIIGLCGLAVDVGLLYTARRSMQTAADAASIAGATALRDGQTAKDAARAASALNGFTDDSNNVSVTVNNPPTSGTYSGNATYVEVVVTQPQPTYFLRVLGYNTVSVSSRAVSGTVSGPACMYSLNQTASNAFVVSGGSPLSANCGALIRSSSSSGLVVSGGSTLTASSIGVVASGYSASASSVTPTPLTNVAPFGDPLAYLQAPEVGACTHTGTLNVNSSTTISQGVYCGGIAVSGGSTTLTLNAGTYILNGGGLVVSGGASLIGNGVTFYNTGTASGSNAYKPIVFSGGSSTSLKAPSSGSLTGILFFQDRTLTANLNQQNTISGSSGAVIQGAMYFPTTPLVYSGGSSINTSYTLMVADTLTVSGSSPTTVNANYASLSGGSPIKSDALYE
jgi:type II secretory pathway pseudopilin PulG